MDLYPTKWIYDMFLIDFLIKTTSKIPGLVNFHITNWNITMLFSWKNSLFRLGHVQ